MYIKKNSQQAIISELHNVWESSRKSIINIGSVVSNFPYYEYDDIEYFNEKLELQQTNHRLKYEDNAYKLIKLGVLGENGIPIKNVLN